MQAPFAHQLFVGIQFCLNRRNPGKRLGARITQWLGPAGRQRFCVLGDVERVRRTIDRECRFTDDAAHELRSLLTAIKTHLQVMRLASERNPAVSTLGSSLAQASQGVLRMQRTLEQLLLLARLDGGVDSPGDDGADALAAARQAIGMRKPVWGALAGCAWLERMIS